MVLTASKSYQEEFSMVKTLINSIEVTVWVQHLASIANIVNPYP